MRLPENILYTVWQRACVLLNMVAAGLSSPADNAAGIAAATASPAVSYQIGQYFKSHDAEGTPAHLLAHTILGAATAAAGNQNPLAGGLSAGTAEAAAPVISQWLYGKAPNELSAEEKSTLSNITGLLGAGTGALAGGSTENAAVGSLAARSAVENNLLITKEQEEVINRYVRNFDHLSFRQRSLLRQRLLARLCARQDCHRGLSKYAPERNINEQLYAQGTSFSPSVTAALDNLLDHIRMPDGTRLLYTYTVVDRTWERGQQALKAAGFAFWEGILEHFAARPRDIVSAGINRAFGTDWSVTNSQLGQAAANGASQSQLMRQVGKETLHNIPTVAAYDGLSNVVKGVATDNMDQFGEGMLTTTLSGYAMYSGSGGLASKAYMFNLSRQLSRGVPRSGQLVAPEALVRSQPVPKPNLNPNGFTASFKPAPKPAGTAPVRQMVQREAEALRGLGAKQSVRSATNEASGNKPAGSALAQQTVRQEAKALRELRAKQAARAVENGELNNKPAGSVLERQVAKQKAGTYSPVGLSFNPNLEFHLANAEAAQGMARTSRAFEAGSAARKAEQLAQGANRALETDTGRAVRQLTETPTSRETAQQAARRAEMSGLAGQASSGSKVAGQTADTAAQSGKAAENVTQATGKTEQTTRSANQSASAANKAEQTASKGMEAAKHESPPPTEELLYNPHKIQTGSNSGEFADTSYIDEIGYSTDQHIAQGDKISRPSWRDSEIEIGKDYPNYEAQKSFINGEEVPYGTKGSVRPEYYRIGHSVEVKNYKIETPAGRNRLINNVSGQVKQRIRHLPEGTRQTIVIDIRGQNIDSSALIEIKNRIIEKSGINIEILFKE